MPQTLAAEQIRIFVGIPGTPASFAPLGGEERARLNLERGLQSCLALGQGAWEALAATRGTLMLEAEGRAQHGPAEVRLHACAFGALPCRLRLMIGEVAWVEADFLLQRFQTDATAADVARYAFAAQSDGEITYQPLPTP